MPSNPRKKIKNVIQGIAEEIDRNMESWCGARDSRALRETELEIAAICRRLGDLLMELVLRAILEDRELEASASRGVRKNAPGRYRCAGRREVSVTLLGGRTVRISASYLKPDRRGGIGRRRTKRGKGGVGLYPALAALGIWLGVTPALGGEVCRQVADSDSVRAGRAALARRDIDLGHKQTLRIVNGFSQRAVTHRDAWLNRSATGPAAKGPFGARRVVISTDGGRLRERVPAKAGRKRDTGHRRYDAPWREPKMLTIYVIGEDGKIDDSFRPVYDGTLGNADAVFEMMVGYLKALGAHDAQELTVIGDGAHWIWRRVGGLVRRVGIPKKRVVEIVDWYHAVETLHEIAALRAWTSAERKKWCRRARRLLHRGRITELVHMIDEIGIGRRAKDIRKHQGYFADNAHRMQYAHFKSRNLPIGSGAMESTVRRVVNMRMKGPGIFWLEPNAEGMLLLRSYLKADRFDELVDWTNARSALWWNESAAAALIQA